MISPHTPPGTKVVTINISAVYLADGNRPNDATPTVKNGETLTIKAIIEAPGFSCGFAACLEELPFNHLVLLNCLRRLDLPKCLTDLLNVAPAPVRDELQGRPAPVEKAPSLGVSSLDLAGALAPASFPDFFDRSRIRAT